MAHCFVVTINIYTVVQCREFTVLCNSDKLNLLKYEPYIHTRYITICCGWGCSCMSEILQAVSLPQTQSNLASSQRLSNCCLIRLSEQMPVYSMQLEVCSLMTSTPDGACELRLEEIAVRDSSPETGTQLSYSFCCCWERKVKWCRGVFSEGNIFDVKLESRSLEDLYTMTWHVPPLEKVYQRTANYAVQKFWCTQSQMRHFAFGANAPLFLCDHTRFGHFNPAHCKSSPLFACGFHYKTSGFFQAGWKGFSWRASLWVWCLYSSLPEWHFAHRGSFAAAFWS